MFSARDLSSLWLNIKRRENWTKRLLKGIENKYMLCKKPLASHTHSISKMTFNRMISTNTMN